MIYTLIGAQSIASKNRLLRNPLMAEPVYDFLVDPLIRAFAPMSWLLRSGDQLSVCVIQAREPDYWFVFVRRSSHQKVELLIDGTWEEVIDYVAVKSPSFLAAQEAEQTGKDALFSDVQSTVRGTILDFPKLLVNGKSGYTIFASGLVVFKSPGILNESTDIYFSRLWDEAPSNDLAAQSPFEKSTFERKAFYCRFLIPERPDNMGEEFKTRLQRAVGNDIDFVEMPQWTCKYGDVDLLIFNNGVLAADHRHKQRAIEALNSFFAYAFFENVQCKPLRLQDVGTVTIDQDGRVKQYSGITGAERDSRNSISNSKLNQLTKQFNQETDTELNLERRLLHLAYNHLEAEEHLQAFTLAWIVIERRVTKLWEEKLIQKGYSGKRLEELCEPDRYTMSVKIDMLEVSMVLPQDHASKLNTIRRARNKASHEGRIPTVEATRDCLSLAKEFIRQDRPESPDNGGLQVG